MADEDESTPLPPDRAPSTIELVVMLDRIRRDIKAMRDELKTAKDNDARFLKMEHNFNIVKWLVGIALAAAIVAVVQSVASRFSLRITDAPVPTSTAERLGADRVAKPINP